MIDGSHDPARHPPTQQTAARGMQRAAVSSVGDCIEAPAPAFQLHR